MVSSPVCRALLEHTSLKLGECPASPAEGVWRRDTAVHPCFRTARPKVRPRVGEFYCSDGKSMLLLLHAGCFRKGLLFQRVGGPGRSAGKLSKASIIFTTDFYTRLEERLRDAWKLVNEMADVRRVLYKRRVRRFPGENLGQYTVLRFWV